jgi:hypothetical protein
MQVAANRGARLKVPAILIAGATILALLSTAQAAAELGYGGGPIPRLGLLKAQLANWYIYALFVPVLYAVAVQRPVSGERWRRALVLSAAVGVACAFAKEMLFVAIGNWFRPGVFRLPEILAGDYLDEVLFFWVAAALIHIYLRRIVPPSADELERARQHAFTVRVRQGFKLVPVDEVEWIEAEGNYVRLHTGGGSYLIRETIVGLERRLRPRFVRVRRNALIDRDRLDRVERLTHGAYRIILASGAAVISGRSYNQAVRTLAV